MTDANEPIEPPEAVTGDNDAPDSQTDSSVTTEKEYGGPKGLEPTRYGDWEKAGRCIDF